VPRVTVIIATYNWATVLPCSIGSVLDQTFTDFELLVIGDGCTDESADVVERLARADAGKRVSWHNLASNTGHQSGPNNEGLRLAQGELIAYLGHDDLWLPLHLERLVAAVDAGHRVAHATTLFVRPRHSPVQWPTRTWRYSPDQWLPPTSVAHARALVDEVGGWRRPAETGADDPETDLWQRMAAVAGAPAWIRRVTSVKLPAGERRDVYRTRPAEEQAVWLARIRALDDAETVFSRSYPDRPPLAERTMQRAREIVALRTRLRRRGVLRPKDEMTAEERWRQRRQFKGLG
jgi:glycosyltransferase involved in cell wall biosynthesis